MSRGRHRHSQPLHRFLAPVTVAAVALACAGGAWLIGEPGVGDTDTVLLRVTAAAAAAAAVGGAVVLRVWDRAAGRRVGELKARQTSTEWRAEERQAELEGELEETREAREKTQNKLREKRSELARMRSEHADLLRRYAHAETERASALEGRRQLELESGETTKALTASATDHRQASGAPTPLTYLQANEALKNLSRNLAREQERELQEEKEKLLREREQREQEQQRGQERERDSLKGQQSSAVEKRPANPEAGTFDFFGATAAKPRRRARKAPQVSPAPPVPPALPAPLTRVAQPPRPREPDEGVEVSREAEGGGEPARAAEPGVASGPADVNSVGAQAGSDDQDRPSDVFNGRGTRSAPEESRTRTKTGGRGAPQNSGGVRKQSEPGETAKTPPRRASRSHARRPGAEKPEARPVAGKAGKQAGSADDGEGAGAESAPQAVAEAGTASAHESGAASGSASEPGSASGSETAPESETEAGAGSEAATEPETDAGAGAETKAETETEAGAENGPESESPPEGGDSGSEPTATNRPRPKPGTTEVRNAS